MQNPAVPEHVKRDVAFQKLLFPKAKWFRIYEYEIQSLTKFGKAAQEGCFAMILLKSKTTIRATISDCYFYSQTL